LAASSLNFGNNAFGVIATSHIFLCHSISILKIKTMDKTTNSLNWFEIPAADIARAKKFYETIFNFTMTDMPEMMGMKMAAFPSETGSGKANGGLAQSPMHKPSMDGVIIYLNANGMMNDVISRIESAGGKILMPKTVISKDIGSMAFFADTEGNKMGLHAGPEK
jgi:predicted enzyme related to lactoylglutathione lyase